MSDRSFIWEILKNTLSKVNSRVVQVKAKLDNFQAQHDANKIKRQENEMTESKNRIIKHVKILY